MKRGRTLCGKALETNQVKHVHFGTEANAKSYSFCIPEFLGLRFWVFLGRTAVLFAFWHHFSL